MCTQCFHRYFQSDWSCPKLNFFGERNKTIALGFRINIRIKTAIKNRYFKNVQDKMN